MKKQQFELIQFEDSSQRATVKIIPEKNGDYRISSEMISTITGEMQLHESFSVTPEELKKIGQWIVSNIE